VPFTQKDKFVIYTKPNCAFSKLLLSYLKNNNLDYEEIEYSLDNLEKLRKLLNKEITYPQVFTQNEFIYDKK
jgi:glutaredoxin